MTTIYDEILANIDADPKAWCKEDWTKYDAAGKPVSRCLIEHVDLALGTRYVKPNGKQFVSKSLKKWRRRARVVSRLAELVNEDPYYTPPTDLDLDDVMRVKQGHGGYRYNNGASRVVDFNDDQKTTKAKVRALLRKAAKKYGED